MATVSKTSRRDGAVVNWTLSAAGCAAAVVGVCAFIQSLGLETISRSIDAAAKVEQLSTVSGSMGELFAVAVR